MFAQANRNPIIIELMESIQAYHEERNICVFELCETENMIMETTNEYRKRGNRQTKVTFDQSRIKPLLDVLDEFQVLHLPIYGINSEVKEAENYVLEKLGSKYVFLCTIKVSNKLTGFVSMDDQIKRNEKYEIPISIASFLSYQMEVHPHFDKENYFIEYLESIDFPTGAFNRASFMKVFLQKEASIFHEVGVLHIDFNEIRKLNEQHGYEYSDALLKKAAKILIEYFSFTHAQVYRISGDEFIVVCFPIKKQKFLKVARRLRIKMRMEEHLNVAVGYTWGNKFKNIFDLVLEAEQEMRKEKEKYYDKKERNDIRIKMIKSIKEDMKQGKYRIYLQPQMHITTGVLVGAEALIRKEEKEEIIYPDAFIPYFEKEGVIRYIDLYVLEEVVKFLKEEAKFTNTSFTISVNFSRVTLLEKNIVCKMASIAHKHQVNTSKICIEVTESMNMMSMEDLIKLAKEIKDAGFKLSLDDYGSHYSNVTILANIDFDEVKLDKSIIQILSENKKARSIVSSTIHMCKGFHRTHIVAEGIETKETLAILKEMKCDYGQGYYFSKAITIEEFKQRYGSKQ